jgi:hypothetical protein
MGEKGKKAEKKVGKITAREQEEQLQQKFGFFVLVFCFGLLRRVHSALRSPGKPN